MKCSLIKSSMTIFLILITFAQASLTHYTSENSATAFSQVEAKFFSNFAKSVNCAEKPLAQSCPQCLEETDGYKFFFYFQTTRMKKYNYKMMIHYNDEKKKVAITFAGPNVQEHHNYIKFIYAKGFSLIKFYRVNIEREYAMIYFGKFRRVLLKKIRQINKSGRQNYEYVLNGYSIGGSMATLAGFDLTKRRVVKVTGIYTYGSLRIGDATFVALVNSTVKVWRIVKESDYIVRIPTCYFSPKMQVWRCFSKPIISKFISQKSFPLRIYVKNYLILFRKSNPVLRKALGIKSEKKKVLKMKRLGNKKEKIDLSAEERKLNKINKISKVPGKKELAKKEKLAEKRLLDLLKKTKLEEMKKKLDNEKTLKKIKNIDQKALAKIIKEKTLRKIKELVYRSKKKGENPKKVLGKKVEKTKKEAKKLIKRLNKEIKEENKQEKKLKKKKVVKQKRSINKVKKQKKADGKEKVEKKSEEKDKNKKSEKKPESAIKKIEKSVPSKPSAAVLFKPTITYITQVRTYTPVQVYFNFIYYTQPIGYEIFYDDEMTTYKTCEYSNGISVCESATVLPTSFTIESHRIYYGVNFDQCTA